VKKAKMKAKSVVLHPPLMLSEAEEREGRGGGAAGQGQGTLERETGEEQEGDVGKDEEGMCKGSYVQGGGGEPGQE
jgi:hypothetical protein